MTIYRRKSQRSSINILKAVKAGFFATTIAAIALLSSGMIPPIYWGEMIVGKSTGLITQFIAGGTFMFIIGLSYGLIYAILFAPIRLPFYPLTNTLIFSIILTTIAVVVAPEIPNIIIQARNEALSTEQIQHIKKLTETESRASADIGPYPIASKPIIRQDIMFNWMLHFIYASILGLLYRCPMKKHISHKPALP